MLDEDPFLIYERIEIELNVMSKRLPSFFIILMLPFPLWVYSQINIEGQYKKQNRDVIAAISMGELDQSIKYFEEYLSLVPDDLESMYGLAMAWSGKGDYKKAMEYVEMAVSKGLPPGRFLAGPRDMFERLATYKPFLKYMEKVSSVLVHGPLLGSVTDRSASFWVRTSREAKIEIKIIGIGGIFSTVTSSEKDYTAVIKATGLSPATTYQYTVIVDGIEYPGKKIVKTFPSKNAHTKFTIGFGGGAGYTPQYERMWDTLATHPLSAFLLLGDNVYIDHPENPIVQQYCYYRRQSREEFRRFTSEVPVFAIWDDHDFTVNDGEGGAAIDSPAWKRPVWELFKNQWPNPAFGGGDEHPGCWFDFSIGDVDFFMLDCRYYRENPKEVKQPSMLGDYQKAWLKEKLKNSKATFKIIASSVPWAYNTKPGSDDTWDGFPEEREELFSFLKNNRIEGVVLFSADRHRSDAWKIQREGDYDLYEFSSSKLTNMHTHEIMSTSLFGYNKTCSFGSIEFNTALDDPTISYAIYSIDNELIDKITVYKSQLKSD